jgi:hypothetical protein
MDFARDVLEFHADIWLGNLDDPSEEERERYRPARVEVLNVQG